MVVNCPTDAVQVVAWADLDGDGWLEQLIGRSVGDAGFSDEDNTENFVITTCGTALRVEPFAITGDSLAIYPVNPPHRSGPDTLLIGFLEGVPERRRLRVRTGSRLVQVQGPGRAGRVGPLRSLYVIAAFHAAESVGLCGHRRRLAGQSWSIYTYRTHRRHTMLSNSTALDYEELTMQSSTDR
jgi:hypothetical protein